MSVTEVIDIDEKQQKTKNGALGGLRILQEVGKKKPHLFVVVGHVVGDPVNKLDWNLEAKMPVQESLLWDAVMQKPF